MLLLISTVFLEADKVTTLVSCLKAVNLSLHISHNLTNHENIPLKFANPKHKLHVIRSLSVIPFHKTKTSALS